MLEQGYGFEVNCFAEAEDCLVYLKQNRVDLIFVSVDVGEKQYRPVLVQMKKSASGAVICLIGKDKQDAVEAYTNKCDLFLKQPFREEELREKMEVFFLLSRRLKSVWVRTFGVFDVFVDAMPVNFGSAKAKELFALCVDHRGSTVTIPEVIDKLWPERKCDEKSKRLYRKAVMMINKTFAQLGIPDVFRCVRGGCMVHVDGIDCDLYRFLKDPVRYFSSFNGRYLIDYAWSEEMLGQLVRQALLVDPDGCDYLLK